MYRIPSWAEEFAEEACNRFIDSNGNVASFDFQYYRPGTQIHDDHLFVFAPRPLEICGGANDGAVVAGPVTVDIRGVQELFTRLESTSYHAATGAAGILRRHLVVTGRIGRRSVSVYVYDEPLDDDQGCITADEFTRLIR
jgi:hypothetical protein